MGSLTMEALIQRGVADKVFLWSDDNLSNDFFWRYLTDAQRSMVSRYPQYAKVCCFKGFDAESLSFNTRAASELFDRQFELFARYVGLRLNLYAYATFTAPNAQDVSGKMARFVERLQLIHPNLPLRTVPLEITTRFHVVDVRTHRHPADVMLAHLPKKVHQLRHVHESREPRIQSIACAIRRQFHRRHRLAKRRRPRIEVLQPFFLQYVHLQIALHREHLRHRVRDRRARHKHHAAAAIELLDVLDL